MFLAWEIEWIPSLLFSNFATSSLFFFLVHLIKINSKLNVKTSYFVGNFK